MAQELHFMATETLTAALEKCGEDRQPWSSMNVSR